MPSALVNCKCELYVCELIASPYSTVTPRDSIHSLINFTVYCTFFVAITFNFVHN